MLYALTMSADKIRVFLDIDINHTREAYQRAKDFVAARNLGELRSKRRCADAVAVVVLLRRNCRC